MFKSYKYRIYPSKQQEQLIQNTFGCCRFVYNQILAYKRNKYENEKIKLSRIDCNNWKNQVLKKEYSWLNEVDKFALDNAIINMDNAYQKFFKEHKGFPKFKSKKFFTSFCFKQVINIEQIEYDDTLPLFRTSSFIIVSDAARAEELSTS